jgi:hypothetical protein
MWIVWSKIQNVDCFILASKTVYTSGHTPQLPVMKLVGNLSGLLRAPEHLLLHSVMRCLRDTKNMTVIPHVSWHGQLLCLGFFPGQHECVLIFESTLIRGVVDARL